MIMYSCQLSTYLMSCQIFPCLTFSVYQFPRSIEVHDNDIYARLHSWYNIATQMSHLNSLIAIHIVDKTLRRPNLHFTPHHIILIRYKCANTHQTKQNSQCVFVRIVLKLKSPSSTTYEYKSYVKIVSSLRPKEKKTSMTNQKILDF